METKDNKDKEFMFSITKEGDSLVLEGSIFKNRPKYFGEYEDAIKYMREEIIKFVGIPEKFLGKEKENDQER